MRDIGCGARDAAIVMAIIALAHVLDLTVVAEGVESAAQASFLAAQGCDELQGNYFSAAVTSEAALELLRRGPFTIDDPP